MKIRRQWLLLYVCLLAGDNLAGCDADEEDEEIEEKAVDAAAEEFGIADLILALPRAFADPEEPD